MHLRLLAAFGAVLLSTAFASPARAVTVDEFDRSDYDLSTSSPAWAEPPSSHHRLYLDIYNVSDFYDSETKNAVGFAAGTFIADTLRPTATILLDERFRIQLGLIALRGYGDSKGFEQVDPWIQLLWQPIKPLNVILGNLDTPHFFLPALFYPLNYVTDKTNETGVQLVHRRPEWYDDLYFNYRLQDTAEHNEKFDLGFVHRNSWKWLRLDYQSHWIHEGGELNPHPIDTINDVAQMGGVSLQFHPWQPVIFGVRYDYLHSHFRSDAANPALDQEVNGDGNYYEAFARWGRVQLMYGHWRGHHFSHEGGDRMFTLPQMNLASLRWDIILSQDFNLLLRYVGYFVGDNENNVSKNLKSTLHLQAAWQFSIPIVEWTTPAASPRGQPVPARWDEGI